MLKAFPNFHRHVSLATDKLLLGEEVIVIVDDDQSIRDPLRKYLSGEGFAVLEASSSEDLADILKSRKVALVLLDIGLPGVDGLALLPRLVDEYPDLAVIMLTGIVDLNVALECIRKGADDFISKPVQFQEILLVVRRVLEKRLLIFERRKYQEDLEKAHFRIQILHQLSLKMNSVYLSMVELEEILHAILVGITAEEGLRFNRAFLAMFDEDGKVLNGRMAIGSSCRHEAGQVWNEIKEKNLHFQDIVQDRKNNQNGDRYVNELIRRLQVPLSDSDHILIKAAVERRSINVTGGRTTEPVSQDLMTLLEEDTFAVVPLYSPSRSLGVIIVDNFVTHQPISQNAIKALEVFASQASLAIEHSRLYMNMVKKISELEAVTEELDKNKDLLVAAERYSAVGHMAAQLVHVIRNPITSIGGVARLLSKRVKSEEWLKFIEIMVRETARVESTLEDLFDFVSQAETQKESAPICPLIRKTVMLLQTTMDKRGISRDLILPEPGPVLNMDLRQIRQMFVHLVKNAIEAMPEGGKLTIALQEQDGWIKIAIIDTGIGIPDINIDKAKDPFFTTKTYGTGMGLTLVERVVAAHNGIFSLNRRPEGGMEALIKLPVTS